MLKHILLALFISLIAPSYAGAQDLQTIQFAETLNQVEKNWLQNTFPTVNINNVQLVVRDFDGPGNVVAFVLTNPSLPSEVIYLDVSDWAGTRLHPGAMMLNRRLARVILHELVHLEQTARGEVSRKQMLRANRNQPYLERPHEIEAYARSEQLLLKFPRF